MENLSYYLFKIAQSFALPVGAIIFFLFLSALFAKRYKKIFIMIAIISYMLTTQFVGNFLIKTLEKPYKNYSLSQKADAVVVLGGGFYKNTPNFSLPPDAFKRLIFAIKVANKTNLPLIFNGAKEESNSAKSTLDELKSFVKIPQKVIFIDQALSTRDNAKLTKIFFDKKGIKNPKIFLVTSAYHIGRAKKDFENTNIKVIPTATDFKGSDNLCYCFFIPSPDGLRLTQIAFHEYFARLVGALKSVLL